MNLPEEFSSLRLRAEIQGQGDYQKTDSSQCAGDGRKSPCKECETENFSENPSGWRIGTADSVSEQRIKFPNIDEEVLKWLRQRDMPTEDNKMEIERL